METTERYAQPKIVEKIVELQVQHDLPVNIIIGEEMDELVQIVFEYELIDYYLVQWLINKGTQYFTQLPAKAIMGYHD